MVYNTIIMKKKNIPRSLTKILVVLLITSAIATGLFFVPSTSKLCELVQKKGSQLYSNKLHKFTLTIPVEVTSEVGNCDKYPLLSIYYSQNSVDNKVEVSIDSRKPNIEFMEQVIQSHDPLSTKILKRESVKISGLEAVHEIGTGLGNFEAYYISNGEKIITIVRYFDEYTIDSTFESIVNSFKKLK